MIRSKSRLVWIGLGVFFVLFVVVVIGSPRLGERWAGLRSVGGSLLTADSNQFPIAKCTGLVLSAEHNTAVVTRAAEYMAHFGSNTPVFLRIAEIAAEAEEECPRLEQVLDLAIMRSSESMTVLELASSACRLETPEEEAAWQRLYDEMLAGAEYSSPQEALGHSTSAAPAGDPIDPRGGEQ